MATAGATGQHSKALRTTSHPGVYQRGSRWVAVYRQDGRQRKEFAATFREAREIKIRRSAEEASRRAGPTLHSYALEWVDHYAGRGANDVINDRTRREYRRLLISYALAYFEPDTPARYRRASRPRVCRLVVPADRRGRSPALRPVGAKRGAAAAVMPASRRSSWTARRWFGAHDLVAAASPRPRVRVR